MICPLCKDSGTVPCPIADDRGRCLADCRFCHGEAVIRCPDCPETRPEPATAPQYVAVHHTVKLGQVTICRAPSHEKAKKLARLFNAFPLVTASLLRFVELDGDHDPQAVRDGKEALRKAASV